VKGPASVGGRERARLFCALRLPDDVLDAVGAWGAEHLAERIVPRTNLHITLAFLGYRPVDELAGICEETRGAVAAAAPIRLEPTRYRETRSVGMLVLDDEDGAASALAEDLHGRLERLGVYEREARPWLPHLTVVRFRRPPRLDPRLPPLGRFSPSDAAVYLSRLSPSGAQYEVVESFALGG
jgi:RNA 2',3'-cyclic 3'-phosphodiesterase